MKISSQEEYGLRCLMRLARVGRVESLSIPEIAVGEGLSQPYVGKLLAVLRQAGILESVRGRAGGYRLAMPPEKISLGMVLRTLGEPLFDEPGYCDRHSGTETDGACVHLSACSLRALWQTLEQWVSRILDQLTLTDLIQSETHLGELLRSRLAQAIDAIPPVMALPLLPEEDTRHRDLDTIPSAETLS